MCWWQDIDDGAMIWPFWSHLNSVTRFKSPGLSHQQHYATNITVVIELTVAVIIVPIGPKQTQMYFYWYFRFVFLFCICCDFEKEPEIYHNHFHNSNGQYHMRNHPLPIDISVAISNLSTLPAGIHGPPYSETTGSDPWILDCKPANFPKIICVTKLLKNCQSPNWSTPPIEMDPLWWSMMMTNLIRGRPLFRTSWTWTDSSTDE